MKKKYIIIIIMTILLTIAFALIYIKINTKDKINISLDDIVEKLDSTSEMKYLRSIYKVDLDTKDSNIIFTVQGILNDVKIDYTYKVKLINKRIIGDVNKKNNLDTFIYLALIDSIFQNYGYNADDTKFVYTSSNYILKKMGIYKNNEDDNKFNFEIDLSKEKTIPKDIEYVSYENLKHNGCLEKLSSYDNFYIKEGNIFVFKTTDSYNTIKVIIIESEKLSKNSYNTVLNLAKALLKGKSYNIFAKEYLELKDYSYLNLNIDVDYKLSNNEKLTLLDNDRLIKITYKYDDNLTLPDINLNIK